MKKSLLNDLETLKETLKAKRKETKKNDTTYISKKDILDPIHDESVNWFDNVSNILSHTDIEEELIESYNDRFKYLLKLSSSSTSRSKSLIEGISDIVDNIAKDLILPIKTNSITFQKSSKFTDLLEKIDDPDESEYISEALDCLDSGYLKAAVVLGWCAAIDRIHRKIDDLGYAKFNGATGNMTGETKGRFKRFSNNYSINSLSELREVLDSHLLWIIEYMQLIDSNEHDRLRSCFDMRCHAAHPGNAPITDYNVQSFFSDVINIVLVNDKFSLPESES